MADLLIRKATPDDAAALLAIYSYYVEYTAISFETEIPTEEEFRSRIVSISSRYPYFVAEEDGEIVGYIYAGVFKGRTAYDWSCESSVYVKKRAGGKGVGKKLYDVLIDTLMEMGITNVYACIAVPKTEDEYLTFQSRDFHDHLGFKTVGTFHDCANKFGRWYDMIWMEMMIGLHAPNPPKVDWDAKNNG